MIRSTVLVVASVLLIASMPLHAQSGSRHSGSGGSGKPSANPSSSGDTEIRDFEREFALQATPDQVSQFQVLSKHTESALKQAHDFVHMIETGSKPPEFSDPADDLQDAVQDAHDGSREFVAKFSSQQKSAYKALTKKLAKANSDVQHYDDAGAELQPVAVAQHRAVTQAKKRSAERHHQGYSAAMDFLGQFVGGSK